MKNPLEKETHNSLIAIVAISGITVAALAYLFLTEDGEEILESWKHRVKEGAKNIAAGIVSDKTGISKKTVKKVADVAVK